MKNKKHLYLDIKMNIRSPKGNLSLTGLTLLEMMIVIIVVGILAAIAVPLYSRVAERGRIAEAVRLLGEIRDAQLGYAADTGEYAQYVHQLGIQGVGSTEVPMHGKYFDFVAAGTGPAIDIFDPADSMVGRAMRNNVSSGNLYWTYDEYSGTYTAYDISIYESGRLSCPGSNEVQKLLP